MRYRTWEHLSAITDLTFGFDHGPKRSLGSGHEDRQPSYYGCPAALSRRFAWALPLRLLWMFLGGRARLKAKTS
jgi:hypothetical protein